MSLGLVTVDKIYLKNIDFWSLQCQSNIDYIVRVKEVYETKM